MARSTLGTSCGQHPTPWHRAHHHRRLAFTQADLPTNLRHASHGNWHAVRDDLTTRPFTRRLDIALTRDIAIIVTPAYEQSMIIPCADRLIPTTPDAIVPSARPSSARLPATPRP